MPIGDPTYSDDESDLSDYAGPDDEIGFDFNFRTPIDGLTASVGAPPDARTQAGALRGDVADESAERAEPLNLLREVLVLLTFFFFPFLIVPCVVLAVFFPLLVLISGVLR